jgi:hypothetical protein
MLFFILRIISLVFILTFTFDNALTDNQFQAPIYRTLIR